MPEVKLPSGTMMVFERYKAGKQREVYKKFQQRKSDAADILMQAAIKSLNGAEVKAIDPILDLHSGDRIAAIMHIRRETFGAKVPLAFKCKKCRFEHPQPGGRPLVANIDLLDFEKPAPLDIFTGPIKLQRSGREASWSIPTGHYERKLVALNAGAQTLDMGHLLIARDFKLDGKVQTSETIDEMEVEDFEEVLPYLNKIGGLNTAVDVECKSCGAMNSTPIERLPDFFFPAVSRPE